jgi:D-alanyl-lipoteichoic acid acyltransferase DltB (MBOAT superfamily)
MSIASLSFLAFGLVAVVAYNLHSSVVWRKAILLIANVAFLSTFSHSISAFVPLAGFLALGYLGVRAIERSHSRAAYWGIVEGTLLLFVWLKQYTFLPHVTFLRSTYTTLGLSYIFFRVMQMMIDANGETRHRGIDIVSYLNYTVNFTTLVAGPIQSYPEFIEQHLAPTRPPLTIMDMGSGLERIVIGFFKVNVLCLVFSMLQSQAITALSANQAIRDRALTGAMITACYTLYLYFNFSGYTDIVIGVAKFLRITLPENFNRPFAADNFLEFWNRWHITLSHWLKTYVYNPLLIVLMRRFPSPKIEPFLGVGAFFVTFFLIGVWHGRTSEFIFFGVLLGAGVSFNKLFQIEMARAMGKKQYRALSNNWAYQAACRGLTFTFFSFSLLWFWANWSELGKMSRALGRPAQLLGWLLIFVASTMVLAVWEVIRALTLHVKWDGQPFVLSRYVRTVWDTALVFVLAAVMGILSAPAPDIVYKAF